MSKSTRLRHVTEVPALPARPANGHKGTFGTVIVVAGSATMVGAPALAAGAALRAGAGLVKIAAPLRVLELALTIEPSATGIERVGLMHAALRRADPGAKSVLGVGPGLGQSSQTRSLVMALLRGDRSMVLDADGLNALAATRRPRPEGPQVVMTPHPGEFRRLGDAVGITDSAVDPQARPRAAAALARAHRAVVVLKGQATVVSDGHRLYVNRTGNPALATAGSGDVLTGVISGLMAQGMALFESATLGVYLHGLAADLWAKKYGPSGLMARDLIGLLPEAVAHHRKGIPSE